MKRTKKLSAAGFRFLNSNRHKTGDNMRASTSAPPSAEAYVCAMGPNRAPAGPSKANSGMNAQTMISVENSSARSISLAARKMRVFKRRPGVFAADQPAVDVLGDNHRGIDDDAEVDRADRKQVGRLASKVKRRKGEQQRQRNVNRHDHRASARCPGK